MPGNRSGVGPHTIDEPEAQTCADINQSLRQPAGEKGDALKGMEWKS